MDNEKRLAVISIIIEEKEAAAAVNAILGTLDGVILARMGLPLYQRGQNIITLIAEAPAAVINSVTGKLGMVKGASAKTLMR